LGTKKSPFKKGGKTEKRRGKCRRRWKKVNGGRTPQRTFVPTFIEKSAVFMKKEKKSENRGPGTPKRGVARRQNLIEKKQRREERREEWGKKHLALYDAPKMRVKCT